MPILEKVFSMFSIKYGFTSILLSLILVWLLYMLVKLFYINKKVFHQQGIPSFKTRTLNFLGQVTMLPRGPAYDQLYPTTVYGLQFVESMRILFQKDDCFGGWILSIPFLALHKADTVEVLLKNTHTLEKAWSYRLLHPWLGTGLLTSKGQKWKSRRKILTPAFHFDILKDFMPIINEKSEILNGILKEATTKEWINITLLMTLCSLDIICETTLGVNINAQEHDNSEYVEAILRISATTIRRAYMPTQWLDWSFFRSKIGQEYSKDLDILHSFTRRIIREKKTALKLSADVKKNANKSKRQALMDLLLNHHMICDDFSEEDVREEVDTFAFEGHDTSAMGLTWALYAIGLYPHVQRKVHEELDMIFGDDDRHIATEDLKELKYLECVIKETQRIYPSVPIVGRRISEDLDVGGRCIPKGTECCAYIYGLHRDPDVFPNPECFDPERFFPENAYGRHPYAYVPFAAGPRNCIGQRFAMMELKVVLATVLRSFTLQSLDTRDKILPVPDLILHPSHPVRVKVMSRKR